MICIRLDATTDTFESCCIASERRGIDKGYELDSEAQAPAVIQRQLFPELDENEEKIVSLLQKHPDGIQINTLVVESNIAINRMTGILFELEMKGIIRTLAGGIYKLI